MRYLVVTTIEKSLKIECDLYNVILQHDTSIYDNESDVIKSYKNMSKHEDVYEANLKALNIMFDSKSKQICLVECSSDGNLFVKVIKL